MTFKKLTKIRRRPRAADHNKIVESVNQLNNLKTGPGLKMVNTPNGVMLNADKKNMLFTEPNHLIKISNFVEVPLNTVIPAHAAMGFDQPFDQDFVRIQSNRDFSGRIALPRDFGNFAISSDNIQANTSGFAYIDGFALVNIVRWFKTPFNEIDIYYNPDYDPGSAEAKDNTMYFVPNPHGTLSLIWEEPPTAPLEEWDETPHYAIVKFNNRNPGTQFAYQTVEGIGIGCPLVPDGGYDDDGFLKLKLATSDDPDVVYVNLGGKVVNYLDIGCAAPCDRMFMGRVDYATASGNTVGVKNSVASFSTSGDQFIVIDYLGENEDGEKYALLMPIQGGGGARWISWNPS